MEPGPPQRRTVLAALAVNVGRPVPVEVLIERVWGADPPPGARRALYAHVARLRRVAERFDDTGQGRWSLLRRAGGYQLALDPDLVDLHRFQRLTGQSGLPDDEQAALLRGALELWRGEPLSGLHGIWVARVREAWHRQRVDAVIRLAGAEVRNGEPAAAAGRLTDLQGEYPLTEPLTEALMRALHATGDTAEALRCYARTRQHLVEELGTEPGRRLQELHQGILRGQPPHDARRVISAPARPAPSLASAAPSAPRLSGIGPPASGMPPAALYPSAPPRHTRQRPPIVPAQLPMDVPGFIGRVDELTRLHRILAEARQHPTAVVISAVSGMAGVGKTTLALHWAQRVRREFPDGQLYVNLRGFDPGGTPVGPERAVRDFLEALGVSAAQMPGTLNAQVGLYRSMLAGRRMLVVLDNARDADQVRPLLPGSPGCLTLITSRNSLTGLAAAEGAHLLRVGLLAPAEARDLFAARLGAARVAAEPTAVDEIVVRCAGLPLALAVVAARAAARPDRHLTLLADELGVAVCRLDPLETGDAGTGVRAVFEWSYRMLSPQAARLFRYAGLHPGPDADATALGALAGVTAERARELATELTAAHLLTEHQPHRYTCHDLLRAYATERGTEQDSEAARTEATRRVLDHYLHTAYAADALLTRRHDPMTLAPPVTGSLPGQLSDHDEALAWFTAEHPVLLSAVERTPDGCDSYTWQLAATLTTFLERQGNWQALAAAHGTALDAARRSGERAGQAAAHRGLGLARFQQGHTDEARRHYKLALDLFADAGNHAGQARTRQNLAKMAWAQGRHLEALNHSRHSLKHFRAASDRGGQAIALNDMGWYLAALGAYGQALTHCRQALPLVEAIGDLSGQAHTWDSLGYVHRHLARHDRAVECYDRALALFQQTGERRSEAVCLTYLGDTLEAAGRPAEALDAWHRALELFDDLGLQDADRLRAKVRERAAATL
ncbi:BTAD domain-containing putative transcriptional regulator [Streptomyces violascens]|uniref:AfsR/SARP family transcriptional regulator n=1 Tax=Streptomyces violascens TaxID=67381 RepID=UPI00369C99F6